MIDRLASFMTDGEYRSRAFHRFLSAYNWVVEREPYVPPTDRSGFAAVQRRASRDTDIADHLPTLFSETVRSVPETIVELGTRGGESTAAFEKAARLTEADLISVDVDATDYESEYEHWQFVQSDDIEFAGVFEEWCADRGITPEIDVLFIDTSHRYEHTVAEIDAWFPHLSPDGVVLFHDTNLSNIYRRTDRTLDTAWDNDRGVIRAIEEYLGRPLDEKRPFTTVLSGFLVEHYPHSNGFTVLRQIERGAGEM
jgi:predicted O-methyltransferase YrrM